MLGDTIRQYRNLNLWTQEQMAEVLGVPCETYNMWETNQIQPPMEAITELAGIFGISVSELMPATVATQKVSKKSGNRGLVAVICIALVLLLAAGGLVAWLLLKDDGNPKNKEYTYVSNPLSAQDVYEKTIPSVVEIQAESTEGTSTGTGFFLDEKGTVVTNYHVIEKCQSAKISLADGTSHTVTAVLGYNSERDIAVLATSCTSSTPLPIRESPVKTGEKVYALGSSLGLTGSLSDGLISAIDREVEGQVYIQTTTPISRGNSGGPLVDEYGAVVGIVCATFTDGQNLNLAIPIADLSNIALDSNITLDKLFPKEKAEVKWLTDYQFEYYAKEDTYVMLFRLTDENRETLSANGTVELRIINDDSITVYNKIHNFTTSDFETWVFEDESEMYMATIYIDPESIEKGTTQHGTVFFVVYGDGYYFEDGEADVSGLPVEETPVTTTPPEDTPPQPEDPGTTTTTERPTTTTTTKRPTTTTTYDYSDGRTCMALDCDSAAINSGYYCKDHTCKVSDCTSQTETGKDYCYLHACDECNKVCVENGNYCKDHTCSVKDCLGSKRDNSNYCYSHKCDALDCKNLRKTGSYYCTTHACKTSGCTYQKTTGKDYCASHACFNCNKAHIKNGNYCKDHTCMASGCTKEKKAGKNYCHTHFCGADNCNKLCVENGSYCKDHTCKDSGCTSKRKDNSQYCSSHTCFSCNKHRVEGGYYCKDHTCEKDDCTERKNGNSDYCYTHD